MNYVKFYGLLGNQHGIQISLNPTIQIFTNASVFEKDGIYYANMNYISNPDFSLNPTKLKQLKKKKYIRVQEHLYEAASVFEKELESVTNSGNIKFLHLKTSVTSQFQSNPT